MEKNINKVILINKKRPQYRWIVRKREDGRFVARVPKAGVLLNELNLKRDKDFGKEILLPKDSKIYVAPIKTKKKKFKHNKTKKSVILKN